MLPRVIHGLSATTESDSDCFSWLITLSYHLSLEIGIWLLLLDQAILVRTAVHGSRIVSSPNICAHLGSIFRATHLHTGQVVALKVQRVDHECPTNRYERNLYPLLRGGKGMPTLWASGVHGMWDYMAIDLLGASLDNLYKNSGKDTMELGSVCSIAMQVVS